MDKIIGFTISKKKISHREIDIFNIGLTKNEIQRNKMNICLWGIGDINNCIIDNKYSLSFPIHSSLLDRNVLIYFEDKNIIVENDWLGSIPVFYNPRELIISTLCLKTLKNKKIHPEGLNNFFEFGYSILEQTPFHDVKFMRYFSKLIINENGIQVKYKKDPIFRKNLFTDIVDENLVINRIREYINNIEDKTDGEIILPASGGYDSRLLNVLVKDKMRIRSFSYGISKIQSKSYEVIYAKKLSDILGAKWKHIELGNYHKYINDWFQLYGFSTHLHGMYHIEFYKKILEKYNFNKNAIFLSGMGGDWWAGAIKYSEINNYNDLITLGYTHGLSINLKYSKIKNYNKIKKEFYKKYSNILQDVRIKTIFTGRLKPMLISYLTQIPEYFGFPVWTPFLNFKIVISMLNIKENIRKNRIWQREYFTQKKLNIESMRLKVDKSNSLDFESLKNVILNPIDINIMEKYVNQKYLEKININLNKINTVDEIINYLFRYKYIRGICKILKIKSRPIDYLYSYYVIKSIEKSLKI